MLVYSDYIYFFIFCFSQIFVFFYIFVFHLVVVKHEDILKDLVEDRAILIRNPSVF